MDHTTLHKHRSFHMPRLLKETLSRPKQEQALSIKRFTDKQRYSIHKSKLQRSVFRNTQNNFPILNESKNLVTFYNSTKFSKLENSQIRKENETRKIIKLQQKQRKRKKMFKLQYEDDQAPTFQRNNRVSIDFATQNRFLDNLNNLPLGQYYDTCKDEQNQMEEHIHYEVDMFPVPNICYDSQFSSKREGDIMRVIQDRIYLMGGSIRRKIYFPKNDQKNKDLLLHYYEGEKWNQQNIPHNQIPHFYNLIGHTTQIINKNTLAFTFGMSGDSVQTLYQFNPNLILFNFEKKQFKEIKCDIKIRSHASTSYDNYLLIHGGINHQHNFMKELHILCFLDYDNSPKLITIPTGEELAHHKMVSTLGMDISARIGLKNNDGIFIFGGENSEGKINNDLKILKLSTNSLDNEKKTSRKFQKVISRGKKPCPRINHTMDLIPTKNKIVIIGGSNQQGHFLHDIWIFDMIFSQWMQYRSNPDLRTTFGGLTKHCSAIDGTKLYIFGGQHEIECGSNNFWYLQFDNSKKLREQRKNNKEKENAIEKLSSFWSLSTNKNIIGSEFDIFNGF